MMADSPNPVDRFEEAFHSVCKYLEKIDEKRTQSEELKQEAEILVSNFVETARVCEQSFLRKHLQIAKAKPEEVLKEECNEIRQEIIKKDAAIEKHQEKLLRWQLLLKTGSQPMASTVLSQQLPPGQLRSVTTVSYAGTVHPPYTMSQANTANPTAQTVPHPNSQTKWTTKPRS